MPAACVDPARFEPSPLIQEFACVVCRKVAAVCKHCPACEAVYGLDCLADLSANGPVACAACLAPVLHTSTATESRPEVLDSLRSLRLADPPHPAPAPAPEAAPEPEAEDAPEGEAAHEEDGRVRALLEGLARICEIASTKSGGVGVGVGVGCGVSAEEDEGGDDGVEPAAAPVVRAASAVSGGEGVGGGASGMEPDPAANCDGHSINASSMDSAESRAAAALVVGEDKARIDKALKEVEKLKAERDDLDQLVGELTEALRGANARMRRAAKVCRKQ